MQIYLLSIQGTLTPPTLEAARGIHNSTAGAPANVAAAKSLGDLSHMVYVNSASEFLILDVWNNMDGLNQFFANPLVQEQGGQIFAQRDPVIWVPAQGFDSYHLPAPFGENERIVSTVRGTVRSRSEAQAVHNTLVNKFVNKARSRGDLSHDAYFRLSPDGESLEFFAIDVWINSAGMNEHYNDPEFLSGFGQLFTSAPTTSVWIHPAGAWVEW